jgi:integrase
MARGAIISRTLKGGIKRYYTALWIETPEGIRKQVWRTFERKKDAESFLDDESKKAREGEYVEPSSMRFEEFAAEWLKKYPPSAPKGMKPSTFTGYQSIIDKHLNPFFGKMHLGQIRSATIGRDFRAHLPQDLAINTKRNIFMALRKMLQSAVDWDLLPANPFSARKTVRIPAASWEKKGRALNPEEIAKLLETCEGETKTIVAATVLTGMRRAEVFGLRWQDIDLEKNLIHVRQTIFWKQGKAWKDEEKGPVFVAPKSKAGSRKIDLSPALRKMLLEHRIKKGSPEGLVFTNQDGGPRDPRGFAKYKFQAAVREAKIGAVRFHDLRHTFGSVKIAQGEDLLYVSRQMGHSSINVTVDIYGHLLRETNPEAAAKTDALIFGFKSASNA